MGLIQCASNAALWRGYDYYKSGKVITFALENRERTQFSAHVAGTSPDHKYFRVFIDTVHPRTSTCNCPHAKGTRIVCKHMVAVYFKAFPNDAESVFEASAARRMKNPQRSRDMSNTVIEYVRNMKKPEMCATLLDLLFECPERQYKRFVQEHILFEEK